MLVKSIVLLRLKVVIGKLRLLLKSKSELKLKKLTKEMKESRRTLLALQASTSPTVADTPRATAAPVVSGAGTEMTMYTAGTEMGGRKSCRE